MVTALSGRLVLDERDGGTTILGALGFSVAFIAPFVAAIASFLTRRTELRRAVWLASALLAVGLGGVTIFGGVGLLFGLVGVGLVWAWWRTRRAGTLSSARSPVVTSWLLVWLGGALLFLELRETSACWGATAGGAGWRVGTSIPTTTCTSDIIDDTEGLLALGGVAIGLSGLALLVRPGNEQATRCRLQ